MPKLTRIANYQVKGGTYLFDTVEEAQAHMGFVEGDKVRTFFYKTDVVSDWVFSYEEPEGFHITAMGGYLLLMTPTYAAAGLEPSDSYDASIAWSNRNIMNLLSQDKRFSWFKFGVPGTYWILGTICPNRHYCTFEVDSGVRMIGRLEDPAIPPSVENNTGGMWDLTLRENYHKTGDMTNTGVLYNACIVLNGTVETVFDASHRQPNNNNCIGVYNAVDCSVVGTGGVDGSDHRGINFDGKCRNGKIDVSFVKGTMDEPLCMHVADDDYGCVKVGRIYDIPFGSTLNLNIGVRCTGGTVDVVVGYFKYTGQDSSRPVLVSAYGAQKVSLTAGRIEGVTYGLRGYETRKLNVLCGEFYNTYYIAGTASVVSPSPNEDVMLENVTVNDGVTTTGVYVESGSPALKRIIIRKCNFSGCGSAFQYVRGTKATVTTLEDNLSPTVSGWTAQFLNRLNGAYGSAIVTSGTTFTYNYKQPDWNYEHVTMLVNVSGSTHVVTVPLVVRDLGSISYVYTLGDITLTVSKSGSSITATLSGGNFVAAYPHN